MSRQTERIESAEEVQDTGAGSSVASYGAPAALALRLQGLAGNHATARALGTVLARQATQPLVSAVEDVLLRRDASAVNGLSYDDLLGATDDQRRQLITLMLSKSSWNAMDGSTVSWIWRSYGDRLAYEMALGGPTYLECIRRGAIMSKLLLSEEELLTTYRRPGVLTANQVRRARRFLESLNDVDFGTFRWALYQAASDLERAFLFKALAAGRTMEHILLFGRIIRGKGDAWLMQQLNLTDAPATASGGTGVGITQQFVMSCGPTSVQTVRAENDPLFALWLRQGGTIAGVGAGNTRLSQGQQTILTSAGGVAVARPGTGGRGAWVETSPGGLSSLSGITGVTYSRVMITAVSPTNPTGGAVDTALKTIESWLDYGVQVPIVIGGSIGATTHYVVILAREGQQFIIHDPWNGVTVRVTRAQFMSNTLSPPMPGGLRFLTAYSRPQLAPS